MDSSEKCVVLATRDKVEFRVPVSLFPNSSEEKITASWSSTYIKTMLETDDGDDDSLIIPVYNVDARDLERVLHYMRMHEETGEPTPIPRPIQSSNLLECGVSKDDVDFIDEISRDLADLFYIMLAANYLDVQALLDLACAKMASMIRGKTPVQILKIFGVDEPFTPEIERQVCEEHPWLLKDYEDKLRG